MSERSMSDLSEMSEISESDEKLMPCKLYLNKRYQIIQKNCKGHEI